jgi:hypothetical protein
VPYVYSSIYAAASTHIFKTRQYRSGPNACTQLVSTGVGGIACPAVGALPTLRQHERAVPLAFPQSMNIEGPVIIFSSVRMFTSSPTFETVLRKRCAVRKKWHNAPTARSERMRIGTTT